MVYSTIECKLRVDGGVESGMLRELSPVCVHVSARLEFQGVVRGLEGNKYAKIKNKIKYQIVRRRPAIGSRERSDMSI